MRRFSVIIACYNAAETLPETLASLRHQTMTDWEAICVDDGSTDATLRILNDAAKEDPRIRVVSQENAGPSRARNLGAEMAMSEWLAFLDADDIWLPEKLAQMARVADATPETAGIYSKISFFDPKTGQDTTTSTVPGGDTTLDQLLGENPVCTLSNLTVRRDVFGILGGFREDMRFSEDLEFLIRMVASGYQLTGTATLLVRYRASSDGLSANLMQMHEGWRQAVLSAGTHLTPQRRARAEALHLRYLARRALRLNVPPLTALRLAMWGVKLAPRAFLGDRHRGPATFVSCLIAPFLPRGLRRSLFA